MSQNNSKVGIKSSMSLMSFARQFAEMKVTLPLINSKTGETFRSCAFIGHDGKVTMVGFSSNLGELTPKQIASMKDELQVVELKTGSYKLCKAGADSWETVDLGL